MSALTKRMSSLLKRPPKDLAASLEKKESPETRAPRLVKEFCEASSANSSAADEVIYLPYIKEAVEASPTAAKSATKGIHKYLAASTTAKPGALYNAVMLLRILTDSPGPAFTQHLDERFVGTVRTMLKVCNKQEPQLLLQQTLEYFQREKSSDTNLTGMIAMWQQQKEEWSNVAMRSRAYANHAPPTQRAPFVFPSPQELVERVAEAETSVQLLTQFLQTTPQEELLTNELVREFTNRCKSARDSMQAYIDCSNPVPDPDTMQTLVQTQQRISVVLNRRNVAMSQARATFGGSPSLVPSRQTTNQSFVPTTTTTTTQQQQPPATNGGFNNGVTGVTPASSPPVLPAPAVASDPASRLDNPFDDSNQIAANGANGGDAGALGGNRTRPALSVNTSYSGQQAGSNPGSNGVATNNNAEDGRQANRFRIV